MRPTSPLLHSSRQLRQYVWRRELVPQGKTLASCMLPGSPKGSKHRVHTSPSSLQNSSPGPPAAERAAWSPALIIVSRIAGNGIFFYLRTVVVACVLVPYLAGPGPGGPGLGLGT